MYFKLSKPSRFDDLFMQNGARQIIIKQVLDKLSKSI